MEDAITIFDKVLNQCLKTPGAKINRSDFLKKSLKFYYPDVQIEKAISTSLKDAEISEELLEKIAQSVIKNHTYKVTGISTLSGMPGGVAMIATIPADLVQFYYHVIVLAQKLAFLYGYPQFDDNDDDEELIYQLTLFIGVMYDVKEAKEAVVAASNHRAPENIAKVPEKALTETGLYMLKKNTARWVGIKLAKKTFSRGPGKIIPVVSGFVSGGISYTTFTPMAQKLKAALEEGYYH